MQPTEEVKRLCQAFGLRAIKMQPIHQGVYRITTTNGKSYCLKRMPYPPSQLRWMDTIVRRLQAQKLLQLGWRSRPYQRQKVFVQLDDTQPPYMLFPWLKGRWLSPTSTKEANACGNMLAKFHLAGSRIRIPKHGLQNTLGSWPKYLAEEQQKLQAVIEQKNTNKQFKRILDADRAFLLRMCQQSIQQLQRCDYSSHSTEENAVICHGDFGPSNILYANGKMTIIDFETMRFDLRAYDIFRAIYNCSHQHEWKFHIAKAILDGYQQVTPLDALDFALIRALLRFPRQTIKLVEGFADALPKFKKEIIEKLPIVLRHEHNRADFLKQIETYEKKSRVRHHR